jgi:acetyl esterase/lipase
MSASILDRPPPEPSRRIPYGADASQFGDLRFPAGSGPWPVVVLIHGGYWRARYELAYFGHAAEALMAAGLATWNIEYRRLGNGGGWPGTFQDVGVAVDHLRALAGEHALDLTRVVTLGHSAGGHLALWAAGRPRIPKGSPLWTAEPLPIAGVVALAGICDLCQAWELNLSDGVADQVMGGGPATQPERYAAACPTDLLPLGVRQTLIHGTADDSVPFALSRDYAAAARTAGDPVELITLEGADHFGIVDPQAPEWQVTLEAVQRLAS